MDAGGPPDAVVDGGAGCPGAPTCFTPADGAPDAAINELNSAAPTLAGGAAPSGWYELQSVDMYTQGTFSGLVQSFDVSSNGNTYGSIEVVGDEWGIAANLDLQITLDVFLAGTIDQAVDTPLAGGGCFTLNGNDIETDFLQCGGSWIDGVQPPGSFEYETGAGTLSVKVILTEEMITTFLPPEYQGAAGLALNGPLVLVLNFAAP
jgi:hypothetical protein